MAKITNKKLKLVLFLAILLGIIASFTVFIQRWQGEKEANQTILTLEWTQLKDVAARQGMSVDEAIAYLQDYEGKNLLNGVVYKEPSLSDLKNAGTLDILTGYEVSQQMNAGDWDLVEAGTDEAARTIMTQYNYIICSEKTVQQEIYSNLAIKTYANTNLIQFQSGNSTIYAVATSLPYNDLMSLGVGYPQADLETIKNHGLNVVIQVRSWPKVDQESIDFVFRDLADYGVVAAGFNDAELPGTSQENWGEVSKLFAEKFQEQGWPLLMAEFFSQKGLSAVASKMDYEVVRMHPVSEAELAKYSMDQIVDRFQLAANERSMGIALVRVYSKLSLEDNAAFLNDVATAITEKGRDLGGMGVAPDMQPKTWVMALAALAIAAGAVPLLARFGFKQWSLVLPAVGFLAALALLLLGKAGLAQKLLGLAAVVIYPTLGVVYFAKEKPQNLLHAILSLLAMTGVSLIGALFVVGMLSSRNYMTGTLVFSGVKIGQLIPLVVLAVYFWYKTTIKQTGENLLLVADRVVRRPVTIGLIFLGVIALGILALFMLRSGNDAVSVSSFERAFRSYLDQLLVVRPRTKEFLFAHPIMLLVLYYGYGKHWWPGVVLGAIGQVSLINTFEHLHTPLWVSLFRTVNGLVLGIVLGVILIFIVKYLGGYLYRKWQELPSNQSIQ